MDWRLRSVDTEKHLLSEQLPLGCVTFDTRVCNMAASKIPQAPKLALLFMGHTYFSKHYFRSKNIRPQDQCALYHKILWTTDFAYCRP